MDGTVGEELVGWRAEIKRKRNRKRGRKRKRGSYESFERGRSRNGSREGKPINFTMANSETVATPFLQFTEVIKV